MLGYQGYAYAAMVPIGIDLKLYKKDAWRSYSETIKGKAMMGDKGVSELVC